MAKRKNSGNKINWIIVWGLVAVTLACLLITFGDKIGLEGIPTWQEITAAFDPQHPDDDGSMPVKVHFFDVGQGDCTLISANGKNILIDAGENDQAERVVNYLKDQNIDKIDILIGTHPHSDHIGGMDAVVNQFSVGEIILPKLSDAQTPTTKTYLDLLTAVADKGVKVRRATPGDTIDIVGGKLEILGPLSEYTDLNNMSVVSRFVYQNASFWIAGDCSKEAEADLLAQGKVTQTNVYKVSHHGSSTASSQKFLDQLQPNYCVISLGADNSYGHPHKEVMNRLSKMDTTVYRTDLNGTVTAQTDGSTIQFTTEK